LEAQTPDKLLFTQIFDSCPGLALDAELKAFLDAVLDSDQVYLAFLATIQAAFEALSSGQVYHCPCDEDWYYEVDLTKSVLPAWVSIENGHHVAGTGVVFDVEENGTVDKNARVVLFAPSAYFLKEFRCGYTYSLGVADINVQQAYMNVGLPSTTKTWNFGQVQTGTYFIGYVVNADISGITKVEIRCSVWTDGGGSGYLRNLGIYGYGYNPFSYATI